MSCQWEQIRHLEIQQALFSFVLPLVRATQHTIDIVPSKGTIQGTILAQLILGVCFSEWRTWGLGKMPNASCKLLTHFGIGQVLGHHVTPNRVVLAAGHL
ncbi:hypothetical protein GDO81_025736 [Engystomops pustulosus]|uniref:Uncharacterized protein n=1 Tax=Engystomops pustulosus TaxID=76066 RepID=A0AAV6ZJ93_ENGPU|nr:hypothetical protein GDO81_025736 [Engystomops pustulosus]